MADNQTSDLAEAIQEVSQRASLLVREEIELAKAEMAEKARRLVVGAVAGAIAGLLAARFIKRGMPPAPKMAIEEGKLIRETVSTSRPATPVGPGGSVPVTTPGERS